MNTNNDNGSNSNGGLFNPNDVDSWFTSTSSGYNNAYENNDNDDGLVIPPHYFPTPKRTGALLSSSSLS